MLLPGTLTITCPSGNDDGERKIKLTLVDNASRAQFLTVSLKPEDFAMALTGLSYREMEFELSNRDVVGKTKEQKKLVIFLSSEELDAQHIGAHDRRAMEQYIKANPNQWVDDGWELSSYLGSQSSVQHLPDDGVRLNVHQFRYV